MVIASLRSLWSAPPKRETQETYIALVGESRKAFFYTDCAVPDTLDGRFDIILVHIFLRIKDSKSEEFARLVLEAFFADMDRNLREMGVGDMGVAKRIKKMAKSAFGRLEAYRQAFDEPARLREALLRNVYRGAETPPAAVDRLLHYMRAYGY